MNDASKMKKCPECGNVVSRTAKRCPQCGHDLEANVQAIARVLGEPGLRPVLEMAR